MDDEVNKDEVIERLISENQQLHSVLESVRKEMFVYTDLNRLTLEGSIAYLVRHKKLLDEIKDLLKKASRNPALANDVLSRVEALMGGAD